MLLGFLGSTLSPSLENETNLVKIKCSKTILLFICGLREQGDLELPQFVIGEAHELAEAPRRLVAARALGRGLARALAQTSAGTSGGPRTLKETNISTGPCEDIFAL